MAWGEGGRRKFPRVRRRPLYVRRRRRVGDKGSNGVDDYSLGRYLVIQGGIIMVSN